MIFLGNLITPDDVEIYSVTLGNVFAIIHSVLVIILFLIKSKFTK